MKVFLTTLHFLLSFQLIAQIFDIRNYGAIGNGNILCTQAIQDAIDACYSNGGGTVLISEGTYLTGTLIMKSNIALKIDSGAILLGSSNLSHYPIITPQLQNFTNNYPQRTLIYAENERNISFIGKGTINGNGMSVIFANNDNRVFGFRLYTCKNVSYKDLTLQNSAFWMMHNCNIDTLTIKNLFINNHAWGNQDGVNIDGCKNVIVENCTIDSNNDPIVMKGTFTSALTENVEVRNCLLATYSRAIKIGTETQGSFKNIYVHDCDVIKSTKGPLNNNAKCGINLAIVDGGTMENVRIENINLEAIITPITIRLGNQARTYLPNTPQPPVGSIKNVSLKNITANAKSNITSTITGIPDYSINNIQLENISISVPGGMDSLPNYIVPENENSKPEHDIFGDTIPAHGIFFRHINGLNICNVNIDSRANDLRPKFIFDDVIDIDSTCFNATIDNEVDKFLLFPNPAKHFVIIKNVFNEEINIYNSLGKIMFKSFSYEDDFTVDTRAFVNGIYLFKVKNKTKKFIIAN